MFGLVRMILIVIFICLMLFLLRKYSWNKITSRWYRVFLILICIFISTIVYIIPFENAFYSFESPESVYEYIYPDLKTSLTVEGDSSCFVVGEKNNKYTCLIVPKTESGWNLGLGWEMQTVKHVISNNIVISIYKHKKTGDTYSSVFDINGNYCDVLDEFETEFTYIKNENSLSGEGYIYYGYIPNYSFNEYTIQVNGEKIKI